MAKTDFGFNSVFADGITPYRTLHNTTAECAIFPLLIVEPMLVPVVHNMLEKRKISLDEEMETYWGTRSIILEEWYVVTHLYMASFLRPVKYYYDRYWLELHRPKDGVDTLIGGLHIGD